MKKMLLSLGLMLSLSLPSFAGNINVDELNQSIKTILAPLQNQNTSASIKFNEIDIDEVRTNSLAVNAHYHKQGRDNHFDVNLDNLQYAYGDGKAPIVKYAGSINVDLSKILPQELINEIISDLPEFLESLAMDGTNDEFGDALEVKGVLTSVNKDSDDNYRGFSAIISVNINLDKLPQDGSVEEAPFTNLVLSVSMDVKSGAHFNSYVVMNPSYKYFQEDQQGLKEFLELLLANDEEKIEELTGMMFFFDELATAILDGNFISKNAIKYLHKK